jgi:hypothetical protein
VVNWNGIEIYPTLVEPHSCKVSGSVEVPQKPFQWQESMHFHLFFIYMKQQLPKLITTMVPFAPTLEKVMLLSMNLPSIIMVLIY